MSESPFFPCHRFFEIALCREYWLCPGLGALNLSGRKDEGASVEYFIIGEGVMKPVLEEKIRELELDSVHILPYQPRSLMPSILAYSDIQFIFMNPEMEMQGFPSKVYTIMAWGRPLLVCSGKDTPIINFLQEHGCAKLITEKSLEKRWEKWWIG